ncbi:hypothetical protein C7974DRAFT_149272 [Boeremia exigua]|uniref:uncharacterized protein n=1 Tax=Boeremia exigua TaxID=749465 RepID=UPI001E8E9155|nr:uncharacterized protein C7974DRAFT_149272 [Boeremia exigua]KAH6637860.1 hypothetical protein C7974DRAFT_149272 [Boeremia exigua]
MPLHRWTLQCCSAIAFRYRCVTTTTTVRNRCTTNPPSTPKPTPYTTIPHISRLPPSPGKTRPPPLPSQLHSRRFRPQMLNSGSPLHIPSHPAARPRAACTTTRGRARATDDHVHVHVDAALYIPEAAVENGRRVRDFLVLGRLPQQLGMRREKRLDRRSATRMPQYDGRSTTAALASAVPTASYRLATEAMSGHVPATQ